MAFKPFTQGARGQQTEQDNPNKAAGFINLYLPYQTAEGQGKRKLGQSGIALRVSNADEAALVEWLAKDPANVEAFKANLVIEFNLNQRKEGAGFTLLAPKA